MYPYYIVNRALTWPGPGHWSLGPSPGLPWARYRGRESSRAAIRLLPRTYIYIYMFQGPGLWAPP